MTEMVCKNCVRLKKTLRLETENNSVRKFVLYLLKAFVPPHKQTNRQTDRDKQTETQTDRQTLQYSTYDTHPPHHRHMGQICYSYPTRTGTTHGHLLSTVKPFSATRETGSPRPPWTALKTCRQCNRVFFRFQLDKTCVLSCPSSLSFNTSIHPSIGPSASQLWGVTVVQTKQQTAAADSSSSSTPLTTAFLPHYAHNISFLNRNFSLGQIKECRPLEGKKNRVSPWMKKIQYKNPIQYLHSTTQIAVPAKENAALRGSIHLPIDFLKEASVNLIRIRFTIIRREKNARASLLCNGI